MTGNNTPVFFYRDPLEIRGFHPQPRKREPSNQSQISTMMWISGRSSPR